MIDTGLVKMQSGVEDDPGDEEAGERRHEAFFGEFPSAAEILLIDALKRRGVGVTGGRLRQSECGQSQSAGEADDAEDEADDDAGELLEPVEGVQELFLVGPVGVRLNRL